MTTKALLVMLGTLSFILPCPVYALTKSPARIAENATEAWSTGTTCSVRYYNVCSGYVWLWSGFEDGERISQTFEACAQILDIVQTIHWQGAPSGYGFTGSLEVFVCNRDPIPCPDESPQVTIPFLPQESGAGAEVVNHLLGVGTPPTAAVLATLTLSGSGNPVSVPTDAGDEPCVPSRTTRSFMHGTSSEPLCPGEPFVMLTESCELLWTIGMTFSLDAPPADCAPIAVESATWSQIKALYR